MATNTTRYSYDPQTGERVNDGEGIPFRALRGLQNRGIPKDKLTKQAIRDMIISGELSLKHLPKNVGEKTFKQLIDWVGLPEDHGTVEVPYAGTEKEFLKNAEKAWLAKHGKKER